MATWRTLLIVALAGGMGAVVSGAEPIEVRPGGVVAWPAEEISACALEGRRWTPVDGICYFPVDLERTGTTEVALVRPSGWEVAELRVGAYPYPTQRLTVSEEKVHLSEEALQRVRREQEQIRALWERETPPRFELPLAAPLEDLPEGGRFGARRIFNNEPRSPHSGADYGVPAGTPVLAADDGEVVLTGDFFFSGRSVFVDHGGGLISMYFHLSEVDVETGQEVQRGEVVGKVGSTGRSTGPHLHFGLRWHGARVDPELLLSGDIPQMTR